MGPTLASPAASRTIPALALANLGLWIGLYTPARTLLPVLVDQLAGGLQRESALGVLIAINAAMTLLMAPVAGALSDRRQGRLSGRRPWILGGSLVGAAALLAVVQQGSWTGLLGWWALTCAAWSSALVVVLAVAAERLPLWQRGTAFGWISLSQPMGILVGVLITAPLVALPLAGGRLAAALLLSGSVLLLVLPVLALLRQPPAPLELPVPGSPRQRRSLGFVLVSLSRYAFYQGWCLCSLFLLYFLETQLAMERSQALGMQSGLIALFTVSSGAVSVAAGISSDGRRHRRPYIAGGCLLVVAGMLVLAAAHSPLPVVLGALAMGLGYGAAIPTQTALATALLPDAERTGRGLGLFSVATTAPYLVGGLLAGPLLPLLGGYPGLFRLAAALVALALLLMLLVRTPQPQPR